MADQPELVGGNQNDQAAQPSATDQNDQRVQLSADKNKKEKKREADRKYRAQKKQKTEDMLKQIEKLKADCAELETKLVNANGKLDLLKGCMEQIRETSLMQMQTVERQYSMINMLEQHLQLPTQFNTGEAGLLVHYPPASQSGIVMGSGHPAIEELSGIPQGWAHGNNVEQPALTSDGHRFVSPGQLNGTNPPEGWNSNGVG